jgi:hypothetical protein
MNELASARVDMGLPWADERVTAAIHDENGSDALVKVTERAQEADQEGITTQAA